MRNSKENDQERANVNLSHLITYVFPHFDTESRAALRLVSRVVSHSIDVNVRRLSSQYCHGELKYVNMARLVSKLPNLESIEENPRDFNLRSLIEALQLAEKISKLHLSNNLLDSIQCPPGLFETLSPHHWPLMKQLSLGGLDMRGSPLALSGPLRLSTLTKLKISRCYITRESYALITPGSWPSLRSLIFCSSDEQQLPQNGMKALLQLTGIEKMYLGDIAITGSTVAQIKPGDWPLLRTLELANNMSVQPVEGMKGLLHLTGLTWLAANHVGLTGQALSQIGPGDWPHLRQLLLQTCSNEIFENDFSDNPVGAVKGLLHLTALEELDLSDCILTGESISQIGPNDWPRLQLLDMNGEEWDDRVSTNFGDNPVGAMKGLLWLTSLKELNLHRCCLTGRAVSQIKEGHWQQLRKLYLSLNDLSDNAVGAVKGLLHLTALRKIGFFQCQITGQAFSQIQPGNWPLLEALDVNTDEYGGNRHEGGEFTGIDLRDNPVGAMRGLLNLHNLGRVAVGKGFIQYFLETVSLQHSGLSGRAVSQIRSGNWSNVLILNLSECDFSDDPAGAIKGLLQLNGLQKLTLRLCGLSGSAFRQIKHGDWPNLESFHAGEYLDWDHAELGCNNFSDDPIGAVKGLLHLTALQELEIAHCGLSGQSIRQIRNGNWPRLMDLLHLSGNNMGDAPVGAVRGLLCLTTLVSLNIEKCGLTGHAVSQIRPNDWRRLRYDELNLNHNEFDDDVEAVYALLEFKAARGGSI
jgi:hypothetical protein